MEIKDSGKKREFNTGAHRDNAEGKGRCDLLPLEEVLIASTSGQMELLDISSLLGLIESALTLVINAGKKRGNLEEIFSNMVGVACITSVASGFYENMSTNDVRNATPSGYFWYGVIQVSKHFEEGAKKYGENNWKKGMPLSVYYDSCMRHLLKAAAGMNDEPHIRAACWNALCFLWTMKNKKELDNFTTI